MESAKPATCPRISTIMNSISRQTSKGKLPMLKRGTYVRTKAIDDLVLRFLADVSSTRKQIISLGAGSDTRYFRLIHREYLDGLSETTNLSTNLTYHEYDFALNVEKKLPMTRQELLFFPYSIRRLEGPCVHDGDLGFPNYRIRALGAYDGNPQIRSGPREISSMGLMRPLQPRGA